METRKDGDFPWRTVSLPEGRCCVLKPHTGWFLHFYRFFTFGQCVFCFNLWWWNHPGWWYRGILALRGEVFKEKRSPSFWVLKSLIAHFSGDTYNASNSEGSPSTMAHCWTCFLTLIDCLEPNWPLFLQVNPPKQGPFQSKQGDHWRVSRWRKVHLLGFCDFCGKSKVTLCDVPRVLPLLARCEVLRGWLWDVEDFSLGWGPYQVPFLKLAASSSHHENFGCPVRKPDRFPSINFSGASC